MQRFTKTGIAILGSAMLLLSACNTNNNAADDNNRSANIENANNGYILKQDRPYRTTTSSDRYPHTTSVQNTNEAQQYYRFINKKIVVRTPDGTNVIPNELNRFRGGNNAAPAPNNNVTPAPNYPAGDTAPVEQNRQPAAQQPAPAPAPAPAAGISNFEKQVIDLTNAQRTKNGLPALKTDTSLSKVAKTKANDMQQKNYFSHTSPTYGSPFDMMRDFGVSYKTAGENIAKGQASPEAVVNAWMNSEGHRKNILSPNFTHIGVGHQANGNYWSQMFIGK